MDDIINPEHTVKTGNLFNIKVVLDFLPRTIFLKNSKIVTTSKVFDIWLMNINSEKHFFGQSDIYV